MEVNPQNLLAQQAGGHQPDTRYRVFGSFLAPLVDFRYLLF